MQGYTVRYNLDTNTLTPTFIPTSMPLTLVVYTSDPYIHNIKLYAKNMYHYMAYDGEKYFLQINHLMGNTGKNEWSIVCEVSSHDKVLTDVHYPKFDIALSPANIYDNHNDNLYRLNTQINNITKHILEEGL